MVKQVKTKMVKTAEPFEGLFPVDTSTLNNVCADMEKGGFDPCHPIIIWKEKGVVIDGHTRLMAADSLKLEKVYVTEKSFQTEDAAVEYAIHCQRDRRNMSDADLMRWVEELDKRKKRGERSDLASDDAKSGKSAAETASLLGTSATKIERTRYVLDHGTPEEKQEVTSKKSSVNKVCNKIKARKKEEAVSDEYTAGESPGTVSVEVAEPAPVCGEGEDQRQLCGKGEVNFAGAPEEYSHLIAEVGNMNAQISAMLRHDWQEVSVRETDYQLVRELRGNLQKFDNILEELTQSVTRDPDQLNLFAECEVSG